MIAPVALLLTLPAAFAIENARVEAGDGTVLERATVVVGDDGRIADVGPAVKVPAGATRIDGQGRVLTPGFFETQSQMGLTEVLAEETTNDYGVIAPVPEPTPGLRAADGFNPFSVRVPITREEGVTTVITSPSGALLYGLGYVVDLTGETSSRPDPARPVAMFGGIAEQDTGAAGQSRVGLWLKLREILDDARFYQRNRASFDRNAARKLSLSRVHLEALAPVLDGKLPLVLVAHRATDLLAAIQLKREQKLDVIVAGGAESWKVARALAEAKVPVLFQPSLQGPRAFETLLARDDTAKILDEAGVTLVLSAGEDWDENSRRLRQEAGIAVAHGLSRAAALRAITDTPARVFRKTDRGLVAKGRRADLVLWSGDPFELSTVAERVWIAGRPMSLDTRQRALAKRYLERAK